ncbi:MAG: FHA domain-containing protein [Phycisphaerales bacterium]|nr:FHA domain-containing protein [Phycisphaerales bacterium]
MYELVITTRDGTPLRRFDLSRLGTTGHATRAGTGLGTGRLLIGRAADCDIRIRAASISRHHCAVEVDEDSDWVIRDLGSTLGTMVEGVKISEAAVEPGLTVQIGPAVLRFALLPVGEVPDSSRRARQP